MASAKNAKHIGNVITKNEEVLDIQAAKAAMPSVPALSELMVAENIKGDISWMMDFAIIGNPKCGTTFLMVSSRM